MISVEDVKMFEEWVEDVADRCYLCSMKPLPIIDHEEQKFIIKCSNQKCLVSVTSNDIPSSIIKWNKKQRGEL